MTGWAKAGGTIFLGGMLVVAFAWFAPMEAWGAGQFSAHMVRHMLVVALAAPLLASGCPSLFVRVPVSVLGATIVEFLVVWGWHVPHLHDVARAEWLPFALEQASFLIAGLLVWSSVLRPSGSLAGAGGLLLTSMHMTLLGALLTLAPRVLYHHGDVAGAALDDQRLGGMIMLAMGTPIYLIAGLILVARALGERPQPDCGAS